MLWGFLFRQNASVSLLFHPVAQIRAVGYQYVPIFGVLREIIELEGVLFQVIELFFGTALIGIDQPRRRRIGFCLFAPGIEEIAPVYFRYVVSEQGFGVEIPDKLVAPVTHGADGIIHVAGIDAPCGVYGEDLVSVGVAATEEDV